MPKLVQVLGLLFFLFLFCKKTALAAVNISSSPELIKIGEEKTVDFYGNLEVDQEYNFKVRVGRESNLRSAETYNLTSDDWLDDYSDWDLMPVFKSDLESTISGTLKFRLKSEAETGENTLEISFRKKDTDNSPVKSNKITIVINPADPTPSPTPEEKTDYDNIFITEIYPSPETGSNEWIELYNDNDFTVNLDNWKIEDDAGTSKQLDDFEMPAKSYYYYAFGSGFLNNNGDVVFLLNYQDDRKDSIGDKYPEIEKDFSWAKVGDSWCIAEPSKGESNSNCYEEEENPPAGGEEETEIIEEEEVEVLSSQTWEDEDKDEEEDESSRNLPGLKDASKSADNKEASVAGVFVEREKSLLTLPIAIASSGLLMLGGSLTALFKPELFQTLLKIFTRN
jgi:lamin tail-like protein